MINRICVALLASVFGMGALAHPFQDIYGDEIRFQVVRNNQSVGSYITRFHSTREGWEAQVEMKLSMPILLLWQYDYHYQASETWKDDRLSQLNIRINDNGDKSRMRFIRRNDRLVDGAKGDPGVGVALPILTSHHFNPDVVNARRILNTLTGQENRVELVHQGEVRLQIGDKQIRTDHYRYHGDLHDTEVWYAKSGQWVKLRFPDRTGALVEFQCLKCGV